MVLSITHTKVSAIADDPAAVAAGEVVPSDWNAAHAISGGTSGSVLFVDGSGHLAQDNTNFFWDAPNFRLNIAQGLHVYNTTDGGAPPINYERAVIDWNITSNVFTIGTQAGGTGVARGMQLMVGGTPVLDVSVTAAGHLTANLPVDVSSPVDGTCTLKTTNAFGYAGFNINDSSGVLSFSFAIGNSSAGAFASQAFVGTRRSGWPLIFITGGTSERMRLDGAGNVTIGSGAIATSATDGFLYLETCAGAPSGAPTSYTGRVPVVIDTSTGTGKLWAYIGGTWRGVALT